MGLLGWPLDEDLLRDCWGAVLEVAVAGGEGVVDGGGEGFWIGIRRVLHRDQEAPASRSEAPGHRWGRPAPAPLPPRVTAVSAANGADGDRFVASQRPSLPIRHSPD